jgi:DNA replication protein DnaC
MSEPVSKFDPEKGALMLKAAESWKQKKEDEHVDARNLFKAALENLPAEVAIPYEKTPEGERAAQFKRVCEEKFYCDIDYQKVRDRAALGRVLAWDGQVPGLCLTGATGLGKTFAAWQALRGLYVRHNRAFAWFPARRLVTELERYEKRDCADDFFRAYDFFRILFVDDVDKINWDYESHPQLLFAFMDWAYRHKKPVIITTNRNRAWWKEKAGDALVRRMFDDGIQEIAFR